MRVERSKLHNKHSHHKFIKLIFLSFFMKKAVRLYITGTMQGIFFRQFIKTHADENNVKGFLRIREDGKVEVFLEGDSESVNKVVSICRRGPKYAQIRNVEEKEERLQDFKEFKILNF